MHRSLIVMAGAALTALAALGFGHAQAAPQALGLVATNGPVGLTCSGAECTVELSTFCLQPDRFAPRRGNPYEPVNADAIRLIGTRADGRQVALDAPALLRFESARNHLAVRVSLSRQQVAEYGLDRITVDVGERVALLPVAEPGDPNPHSVGEIAVLTSSLRSLGSQMIDRNAGRMQAARITNRLINLLPPDGKANVSRSDALWQRAVQDAGRQAQIPAAQEKAHGAYGFCRFAIETGVRSELRSCLQTQHDAFMKSLNSEYWDAIKTGS
jgi:hypothetical protein